MLTPSLFAVVVALGILCVMLSAVEMIATSPANKLAMQTVLLMSMIAWLARAFHLTGPVERLVGSYGRAWVEYNPWGW